MMHFIPGQLPEPVVLPLGEPTGQAITTTGGLWGMPIWR
jgi:hypothetical protein